MSMLVAAQVTALATTVLAVFAIVAAVLAAMAFRKQSAEVASLQKQTKDQAKMLKLESKRFAREVKERRKEHANQISVWPLNDKGPDPYPVLSNTSGQPAYRCVVSVHKHKTEKPLANYPMVDVLPPNDTYAMDWATPYPPVKPPPSIPLDVSIRFTDRNGVRWERDCDGQLHTADKFSHDRSEGKNMPSQDSGAHAEQGEPSDP